VPADAVSILAMSGPAVAEPISHALDALQLDAPRRDQAARRVESSLSAVLGAPPEVIEQVTFLGLGRGAQDGIIVRTARAHDFRKASFGPAATEKQHAGKVYYKAATGTGFGSFPDDRTALFARQEADLRRLLDAGPGGPVDAAWAKLWKEVQAGPFASVLDLAALRRAGGQAANPLAAALGPAWEKPAALAMSLSRGAQPAVRAVAVCASAAEAAEVRRGVAAALPGWRQQLAAGKQALAGEGQIPAEGKRLAGLACDRADALLRDAKVEQDGSAVRLTSAGQPDVMVLLGAAWVMPTLARK
jgi:hypothetical protein